MDVQQIQVSVPGCLQEDFLPCFFKSKKIEVEE
jgi:hypothetical protein